MALRMHPEKDAPPPSNSLVGIEIITDKGQQMETWVEHYSDLYSRENIVSPATLDPICYRMPAHHGWVRLGAIGRRTQQSHRQLGLGQGPWQWWDSPDLIKHCKITLLLPLQEVLCQCCPRFLPFCYSPRLVFIISFWSNPICLCSFAYILCQHRYLAVFRKDRFWALFFSFCTLPLSLCCHWTSFDPPSFIRWRLPTPELSYSGSPT